MPRPGLTTTQRGLGYDHQSARERALASLKDGDLCARCQRRGIHHPMYRHLVIWKDGKPRSPWLDLDDFPGRTFGGPQIKLLSWRRCNRSAGAALSTPLRLARLRAALTVRNSAPSPSRNW